MNAVSAAWRLCACLAALALAQPLVAAGAVAPAHGQSASVGSIAGTVSDGLGAPVPEALVTISEAGLADGGSTTETDRQGRFRVDLLPPGEYEVLVERLGFAPTRVRGVRIRPGAVVRIGIGLDEASAGEFAAREQVLATAGPQRVLAAAGLGVEPLARTPVAGWELAVLHRLSTRADATGAVTGLPREWAGPVVDGAPISLARHPTVTGLAPGSWSFPAAAVETAEMAAAPIGAAAHTPGVRLHTRRGAVRWGGRAEAAGLALSPGGEGGDAGRAAFTLGGPMLSDSAHLTLSAQLERGEQPIAAFWPAGEEAAAWQAAALERYDRDLAPYLEPGASTATSGSLFGRFDWKIAAEHLLSIHGAFSRQDRDGWAEEWAAADLLGLSAGTTDAFAGVRLTSLLTDALSQETGITVTRSARAFTPRSPTGSDAILPATKLADTGARIGRAGVETGDFERTSVRVESGVAYRWTDHTFRGGVALDLDGFRDRYDERSGELTFADVERFRDGVGAFAGQRLDTREVRYTSPRLGAWIGDSWLVREGLELEATVRFDAQRLPADEVRTDATWGRYTGLDNAAAPGTLTRASPSGSLSWDVDGRGQTVLRVGGGLSSEPLDPAVMGRWVLESRGVQGERLAGDVGTWPGTAPITGAARLTLLDESVRLPRTAQVAGEWTQQLPAALVLTVGGMVRETAFLPRWTDLNVSPTPAAHDQYGRPIFGRFAEGVGMPVAEPGSNRRFDDYDVVTLVTGDGRSLYRDLTVSLERSWGARLRFLAAYTHSRTEDDLFGARDARLDGRHAPRLGEDGGQRWAWGTSDFDLPHRLQLVGEVTLPVPGSPSITALYSHRSGYPFTPGFAAGVDVSADGSGRNDPAFVDPAVPGMDELLASWPCLQESAGDFAARNSCRAPTRQSLDLRLGFAPLRVGGVGARLYLEALDLGAGPAAFVDRALYRIDTAEMTDGALRPDGAGVVHIPLRVNPHFGTRMVEVPRNPLIRFGLEVEL